MGLGSGLGSEVGVRVRVRVRVEADGEKVDRAVELFIRYYDKVEEAKAR